ncbi:MAG TPA: hypothetical protein VNR64_10515, partial [Vicinamibacterales bacterium]|nr:hypothetical protein [Vicinamibacterales bacterium]
ESTASAIIRIAREREFAVECSARARQLVRSEYSEFALVDRLAALYERLLSRKRTRSNEPGTLARRNA